MKRCQIINIAIEDNALCGGDSANVLYHVLFV
jgi:hypothetical protein